MRIAAKFTVALLTCLLAALMLRTYLEVKLGASEFRDDAAQQCALMGRALRPAVSEVWRADGRAHALRVVGEANQRLQAVDIRWVSLLPDAPAADRPAVADPRIDALRSGEETVVFDPRPGADGAGKVYAYVPLGVPAKWQSALEVSQSLRRQVDAERGALRRALAAAATTLVLAAATMALLGFWFVGRPMRGLIAQARRVGAGDLSQRIELRQRDEIGALATEMNRMTEQLVDSQESARRANEAKLKAVDQLRHADRLATVGRLAAGMAHELGTPLNVVQARARSIADGKVSPETARSHASIVVEQVDRMTRLMRQLLDFARKRELKKDEADLSTIVRRSITLTGPVAAKRNIAVAFDPVDREAVRACVDGAQIEQVLTNLLTNAIHASADGGHVIVRLERAADGVAIAVEDRGTGIDEANLPRIFEPFFTTKEIGTGTGLGLSVAYGIVQDHGGTITVESAAGRGSIFTVKLPDHPHASVTHQTWAQPRAAEAAS